MNLKLLGIVNLLLFNCPLFCAIPAKKIVLCTGPSYSRREQLIEITARDLRTVPFKKVFIATNDPRNLNITIPGVSTVCQWFSSIDKQLDCLNCIIDSVKMAVNDPEVLDDDIILFKHESVFINDMYLFTQALQKLSQGYDIVIKNWIGFEERPDKTHLKDYCHTDCFLIKVSSARVLFKDHKEVTYFVKGDYHFCEEYFTKYIVNQLPHPFKIDYHHSSWKDNELGMYHIPRYEEDPLWYWDKKNYYTIYQ